MSTTVARAWLGSLGRLVLAFAGSVACLLVSAVFVSMIDSWFVTRHFALPFSPQEPVAGLGYLLFASLVGATALLTIAAIPLIVLKRESLIAYLVLFGALPLILIALPATDGNVVVLACAAAITALFWWFSYRRSVKYRAAGTVPVLTAWLALLVGVTVFAVMYWSDYRTGQIAVAERARTMMEPAPLDGTLVGREALLYDFRGRLFTYDLQNEKRKLLLEDGVIDVEGAGDGSAWILSAPPLPDDLKYDAALPPGSFTLSRYRDGRIETFLPVEFAANERPFMIAIRDEAPVLIGRMVAFVKEQNSYKWQKVEFDKPISDQLRPADGTALISSDGQTAFVGINLGEWGGGLAVVDLTTGDVGRPEKRGPNICDGPLNSACDPVTGIVPDPDDARCILASIGLSHFRMHGRILKVCQGDVSVEFTRPLERPSESIERYIRSAASGNAIEPSNTEAIFALITARDGSVWAISPFAAYRKEGARWSRHPMPELEQRGSLALSDELPGIVLLSSWRHARNSLSGPMPMAFRAN